MKTFVVRTGLREVGRRQAFTAQQALLDYARSMGCQDDEIMRLGPDAVSWRGAVYSAAAVPEPMTDGADGGTDSRRR
jgi:hypothetical protein